MNWQTIKSVLLGAVGGAIVWWIVLGAVLGWMSPGSAESKAEEQAQAAVLDALVPICVATFNEDAEKAKRLEALKEANAWERGEFVVEQGWATLPGHEKPDTRVAGECATRILAASSS